MAHKTKVGGTIYDTMGGKCRVNGTGYSILGGRTLVGGTGYDISFKTPTPIGNLPVGSGVYLNVGGTRKLFIIVNQGLHSSEYDSSCNGTWLLMKEVYVNKPWVDNDNLNDYRNSSIHNYLNTTFLNLFDADVKSKIKYKFK